MKKTSDSITKELRLLGKDLINAAKKAKSSEELDHLSRVIVDSAKHISKNVQSALKSAQKSQSAKKISGRLKNIVHLGKIRGKDSIESARLMALKGIKKAKKALK